MPEWTTEDLTAEVRAIARGRGVDRVAASTLLAATSRMQELAREIDGLRSANRAQGRELGDIARALGWPDGCSRFGQLVKDIDRIKTKLRESYLACAASGCKSRVANHGDTVCPACESASRNYRR